MCFSCPASQRPSFTEATMCNRLSQGGCKLHSGAELSTTHIPMHIICHPEVCTWTQTRRSWSSCIQTSLSWLSIHTNQSYLAVIRSDKSKLDVMHSDQCKLAVVHANQSNLAVMDSNQSNLAVTNSKQSELAVVYSNQSNLAVTNANQSELANQVTYIQTNLILWPFTQSNLAIIHSQSHQSKFKQLFEESHAWSKGGTKDCCITDMKGEDRQMDQC